MEFLEKKHENVIKHRDIKLPSEQNYQTTIFYLPIY